MRVDKYLPSLRSVVNKNAARGERILGSLLPGRGTGYFSSWSTDKIEQVQHLKSWVYVCIDLISSRIGSITPNIAYVTDAAKPGVTVKACERGLMNLQSMYGYNKRKKAFGGSALVGLEGNGSQYDYSEKWNGDRMISGGGHSFLTLGEYRSKALSVVKPHEDLEPLENYHPLRRLLENPNAWDTTFDILYETQMFQELCGVSYIWAVPNDFGVACELWCIPSHWVWPRTGKGYLTQVENDVWRPMSPMTYVPPDNPNADKLIEYFEVRPYGGMGSAGILRIPPDQIIMERWKSPISKLDGYSKLFAISQWIDLEESITKSRWSQMVNTARPELWLQLGPGYEDPSDNMIARIESKFAQKFQGEFNYGKPIITPPGAILTPLSFSPAEMAYFASEDQMRDMICATFRIPKSAIGLVDSMTYGSILATLGALCSECLNPRLVMRGQSLTKHLASRWNEEIPAWSSRQHGGAATTRLVKLWWDDTVPADPQQVNSDLAQDASSYAVTPNEIRALRGRPSYKLGGNNPLVAGPGGVMPLPINEEEEVDELAEMVAQLTEATSPQQPEQPGMEGGGAPGEGGPGGVEDLFKPELPEDADQFTEEGEGEGEDAELESKLPETEEEEESVAPEEPKIPEAPEPTETEAVEEPKKPETPPEPVEPPEPGEEPAEPEEGKGPKNRLKPKSPKIEHPNGRPTKSLTVKDVHVGTCKPGERASVTGCTPAQDMGDTREPAAQEQPIQQQQATDIADEAHLKVLDSTGAEIQKDPAAKSKAKKAFVNTASKLKTAAMHGMTSAAMKGCDQWLFSEAINMMQGGGTALVAKAAAYGAVKAYMGIRKLMGKGMESDLEQLKKIMQILCEEGGFKMPSDEQLKLMVEGDEKKKAITKAYFTKSDKVRDYSCVLVEFTSGTEQAILDMADDIPDMDLAEDGRETRPHITVKYGLAPDALNSVRQIVQGFGPIQARLGRTSLFEKDDSDVIKIDVESGDLHLLNAALTRLPHNDSHPEYLPHVTLGYVMSGLGSKYVNLPDMEGQEFIFDKLIFVAPDKKRTIVELGKVNKSNGEKQVKKGKQELYDVGIAEVYFSRNPAGLPVGGGLRATHREVVQVRASGRTEAAQIAWQQNGARWEAMMLPPEGSLPRKVSLDVSSPKAGVGGILGRLTPINVKSSTSKKGLHWSVSKSAGGEKTVAVDLDGTICEYDGWKGEDHFGAIRDGAKESLDHLKSDGWEIIIWTTRGNVDAIGSFLDDNGIPYDYINTNPNQPEGSSDKIIADVYIDDRAINALRPWDKILADVLATQAVGKSVQKNIAFDTVEDAGHWLANQWGKLEARYSRAGALSMAAAMLATMPLPGNIPTIIAIAEGVRGIHNAVSGSSSNGGGGTCKPGERADLTGCSPHKANGRVYATKQEGKD